MQSILSESSRSPTSFAIAIDNAIIPSLYEMETALSRSLVSSGSRSSRRRQRHFSCTDAMVAGQTRRRLSFEEQRLEHRQSRWNAAADNKCSATSKIIDDCSPAMMNHTCHSSKRKSLVEMVAASVETNFYDNFIENGCSPMSLEQAIDRAVAISTSSSSSLPSISPAATC